MCSAERFPETRFSILEQLGSTDDQARNDAFDVLVRAYWQPVYTYLRLRWRLEADDAQDASQSFLTTAWSKGYFEGFDAKKARFRTFLRVCLDRFVQNQQKAEQALKRGGGALKVSLDDVALVTEKRSEELLALDEALEKLAAQDPRKAQIVELRYFGGLTQEETAAFLKLSERTVRREWRMARTWLSRALSGQEPDDT